MPGLLVGLGGVSKLAVAASANATASGMAKSAEHSQRTTPDHGAVPPCGNRRYHDSRLHFSPITKRGDRVPGSSPPP